MVTGMWMGYHYPYPPGEPRLPTNLGLQDLFVLGMTSPFLDSTDREELWQKLEMPYRPEVMINWGANMLMSIANKDDVAKSLASYKFVISFELFLTESANFADIVLPDCSYLQSYDSRSNFPFIFSLPAGMGEWCWPIRQPVLPPDGEQRPFADVLLEIADRAGFRADFNAALNASLNLQPPYRLAGDTRYTYEQVCDSELRNNFGPDRGLEWFKQHGVIKWKKKPQEVYWRPFVDVRVPIYWEFLAPIGRKTAEICEPRGFKIPMEFFDPLPDFHPCMSHRCDKPGFDFYAFYYRDAVHTNSFTMENPWLDEAARLDPFSYTIAINAASARKRRLADGQAVWLETETGRRVKGRLKLTEGIHPEGVGIAAMCGHWSDGMPVAKGKGVFFNDLLELDWEHVSPVNNNLDLCARVRVVPAESGRPAP
jgi:molybdopterin-containing oxidoreductase family molybdopterin binding subunit